jgi:hypothetical protein
VLENFRFEYVVEPSGFIVDGTINEENDDDDDDGNNGGITMERFRFVGKSRNEVEDDDVVDAGEMGVNVIDDDDEHVEFVGLGQILGEFGGGKRSTLSGC